MGKNKKQWNVLSEKLAYKSIELWIKVNLKKAAKIVRIKISKKVEFKKISTN